MDNAIASQATTLEDTVKEICTDEFVNEPTFQNAPPVKECAGKCQDQVNRGLTESLMIQLTMVIQALWPAVAAADKFSTGPTRTEACMSSFHRMRSTSSILMDKVNNFLRSLSGISHVPHLFVQMFLRIVFEKLVLRHEEIAGKEVPAPDGDDTLSRKEKNALRYAAGYIIYRLPRKVNKKKEREGMMKVIEKMKEGSDKDTRLSYTREWVETQSRGGLTMINDGTFLFFEKIELKMRQHIPTDTTQLRNMDILTPITSAVLEDRTILEKWTSLCVYIELSEHASLIMLQILVGFYVQIRLFSFTKNIVERYKIHEKKQKQSRGLRGAMKRANAAQDQ